ncbi:MAG: sortase [Candidatus Pacebacteria bacterium]|nr:sortase [Candidatus Paceibacterota bacterium]
MIKNINLFFKIFIVIFAIIFFILNGTAFPSWVKYKSQQLTTAFQEELFRPPVFLNKISPLIEETEFSPTIDAEFPILIEKPSINLPNVPAEAYENNILELPQFNIKAPIRKLTSSNLDLIYGELKKGVVLYPGSSIPGQGYSIIIGHSSQYPWESGKYRTVFALLNELELGDKIYVFWEQKPLIFEVTDKQIFIPWPQGSETTETVFPPSEEPTLILQSCWPVGAASKRVAIKTVLVR